ncbi:hypothetical protein BDZ89DRAFT_1070932 [Hymenopellis radicata]|nr:hypothetical protein BDZ89DRAFT_1070932 [Hymenopellis radicata]
MSTLMRRTHLWIYRLLSVESEWAPHRVRIFRFGLRFVLKLSDRTKSTEADALRYLNSHQSAVLRKSPETTCCAGESRLYDVVDRPFIKDTHGGYTSLGAYSLIWSGEPLRMMFPGVSGIERVRDRLLRRGSGC